ncbi:MAG: histidine triad nucleotide-binding protein [Deltaproteobacteria bacterium]|nr:histidine triad nucleotide-binding protein [Deltaproteobacteria bacterium]
MGCIFCKIIAGEIPSNKIYEDDFVYAFDDIQPQAPVHSLIVPKKHIESLNDLSDTELWAAMLNGVHEVAKAKGIKDTGYRIVVNCGPDGTQIVWHLHMHVLGGELLDAKMG